MTNLRIEYWANDEKFAAEVDVGTAMDAALWMYVHLKDWCVDEDIRFYIDNEEVTDRQFAPSAEQHEETRP